MKKNDGLTEQHPREGAHPREGPGGTNPRKGGTDMVAELLQYSIASFYIQ